MVTLTHQQVQPTISRVPEGVESRDFVQKGYLGRALFSGDLCFGLGGLFSVGIFWVGPFWD